MATLVVNELFHSIQGESTWTGQPCVFIRLTGCPMRCHYCDTAYAFHEGDRVSIDQLVGRVQQYGCDLVQVTGGEPLLQPNVHVLMRQLCDLGKTVLLETGGSFDISGCDRRVIRIMDLKSPGSGEYERNLWSNIDRLNRLDEVKFVLCDRRDYEWARDVINQYGLTQRVNAVLMSAVAPVDAQEGLAGSEGLNMRLLAQWILADRLKVRLQTQLHKVIWDGVTRGV